MRGELQERLDEEYRVNSFNVKIEVVTKRVLEHMVKQIIKETTTTATRKVGLVLLDSLEEEIFLSTKSA